MDPPLNSASDGQSRPSPKLGHPCEDGACPTSDNGILEEGASYDAASLLAQVGQPSSGAWTYTSMAHLGSGDLAAAWETPGQWDACEQHSHLARPSLPHAASVSAGMQPLNPYQQLPSQAAAQPAQLATQHEQQHQQQHHQQQPLALDGSVRDGFFLTKTRSHVPTTDHSLSGLSGSTGPGSHRTGSYQPPFCPPEIGSLAQLYAIAAGLNSTDGPLDVNRSSAPVSGLVTSPQFDLTDPLIQPAGTMQSQLLQMAPAAQLRGEYSHDGPALRSSGSISYGQSLSLPPVSGDFSAAPVLLQGSGTARVGTHATQAQALLSGPARGSLRVSFLGRQRSLYDVGGQTTLQQQAQLQPQQAPQRQQQQVQAQRLQQHQQAPQWQQQLLQVVQQQQQQQQQLYSSGPDEIHYPQQVQQWQQQQTVQQPQQQLLYISGGSLDMQQQLQRQPQAVQQHHPALLVPGSEAGEDMFQLQRYSLQWQQHALQQQQQRPLFLSGGFEQVRQVHPLRQQPPLHIQQQLQQQQQQQTQQQLQQQQQQQAPKHTMAAEGRHTPSQLLSMLSNSSAMGSGTSFTSLAPSMPAFGSSAALSGASFMCTTPMTAARTPSGTGSAASFLCSAPSAATATPSGVASGPAVHAPVLTQASASLYVKNLPPEATELMLYQKFSPFGPLMSCKVHVDSHGKCKGVGFVNFADHEDAMQAMQLHGARMSDGRHLHVEMQEPRALHAAPAAW